MLTMARIPSTARAARTVHVGPVAAWRWLVVLTTLAGLLGCDDLDDFRTGQDEAFVGSVVGNSAADGGDAGGRTFLLRGFETRTVMELEFDPSLVGSAEPPGRLNTYTCDDGLVGRCPDSLRSPGPINDAELRPIDGLQHDALSRYDFPGASRLRNYMFHVGVGRSGAEGAAMVFLSLMESGRIEVRIISPMAVAGGDALFGVFQLNRQSL